MINRLAFPQYLLDNNLTGEGVEIGVLFGEYSEALLSGWPGVLHLVDPWMQQKPTQYRDGCNAVDMDEAYRDTLARVAPYTDRVHMHRAYSHDAVKEFAVDQLDFVYIDGNHAYAWVKQDLELWWPKIKEGGILCGHDYYNNSTKYQECGVKQAVEEFARLQGLKLHLTPDCTSWWLTKRAPTPLLPILGLSHADFPLTAEWLRWMHHLCTVPGGSNAGLPFVIAHTQRVTEKQVDQLRAVLPEVDGLFNIEYHELPDVQERGYPGSASHLFLRALQYAESEHPGRPILWLEPDTVLMRPDWLQRINDEYLTCGAAFLGFLEKACKPPHMAGVGVYPHNWRKAAPSLVNVLYASDSPTFGPGSGQAFDTYAAHEILPKAAHATTIQQIWKPTVPAAHLIHSIKEETMLFHQWKGPELMHEVARREWPAFLERNAAA